MRKAESGILRMMAPEWWYPDGDKGRTDPEQVPEHHCLTIPDSPQNAGFVVFSVP